MQEVVKQMRELVKKIGKKKFEAEEKITHHFDANNLNEGIILGLEFLTHPNIQTAIHFGMGQIQLANIEKDITSGTLLDDAQVPPRLNIPNNLLAPGEMYIKKEIKDKEVPDLESGDEGNQDCMMRITEMEEETFIWTKIRTYIPPNTT
uniref:Uncharacterized protein n=1 Tax=Romanomermis culicivorax TaxID=13658 RepID=A0A915HYL4_ROMCU